MSKPRVGINGFGRIGRVVFRAAFDKLDIRAINDTSDLNTNAHLLEFDSVHGHFKNRVSTKNGKLVVDNSEIFVSNTKNPAEIPWKEYGVDLVLECTGALKKSDDALLHIDKGGAKRVMISAPADDADFTVVMGINHTEYNKDKHRVVSNASCTTNCLAPVVQVLHKEFGIESGFMTTVHSYTNDQKLLDAGHKDLRRARAAALSMIPTTTGAAKTVGRVIPELKGKIDGTSVRVPTPNVSLVDFVAVLKKDATVNSINETLVKWSQGPLKGILACEAKPLVSSDFNGNTFSSTIDLQSTMMIGPRLVKVFAWYDNETGFSHRMADLALYMNEKGL